MDFRFKSMTLSYSIQMITRSLRTPSAHDHARVRGPCTQALSFFTSCSHNVTASVTLTPRLRRLYTGLRLRSRCFRLLSLPGLPLDAAQAPRHALAIVKPPPATYAASRASNVSFGVARFLNSTAYINSLIARIERPLPFRYASTAKRARAVEATAQAVGR